MTALHFVPVETPAARELAELSGIRSDLQETIALCERLLPTYQQLLQADQLLFESYIVHAVIKYTRCFGQGVRPKISAPVVTAMTEEQSRFHEFVGHYRNKFVAHSVNPYESNTAVVGVPHDAPGDWKPTSLAFFHSRAVGPGPQFLDKLAALARFVSDWVGQRIDELQATALQDLTLQQIVEIMAQSEIDVVAADPEAEVGRRRK